MKTHSHLYAAEYRNAEHVVEGLLSQYRLYKEKDAALGNLVDENDKVELRNEMVIIGDRMFFDNPLIWMKYKRMAYKGSAAQIATLGDLVAHVASPTDICAKRFHFLNSYVRDKFRIDLKKYNQNTPIADLEQSEFFLEPIYDEKFMSSWNSHEHFIKDEKVSKWGDYDFE